MEIMEKAKIIEIDPKNLPIILKIVYNGNVKKEYVLNATKNKKGIYLNTIK